MNLEKLLSEISAIAKVAGAEAMEIYATDFAIYDKADKSPVTEADERVEAVILARLAELTPDIPVISEEAAAAGHIPDVDARFWLVDPLDGTKEFIKKNGEFTVNIALVENQVPVMGVIYVPARDILYWGWGKGAFRTLCPCSLPFPHPSTLMAQAEPMPLADSRHDDYVVVASRSHLTPETQFFIDEMQRLHAQVRTVSSGSSIKICMVAEGTADAYPRDAPTMEWDIAAGDAIARAAGRSVTDSATGLPLLYNKENLLSPWFLVD